MTMAFVVLALLQLFAALGFHSEHSALIRIRAREHPILWLGLGVSAALQLVVVFVPALRDIFGLTAIPAVQWSEIFGMCLLMLLFTEAQKLIARARHEG
ncbi:hypothetical protein SDC9_135801 [bioreactor metagenome]|uniref:Cation-transporting P-type ATPase C-terminal domain-containing protein n=1 Tax=bioreactor metagenome TaxID=1076179 RepID=A0A645DHG4_9ZZZZ